jgi:cytochrome c553
MRAPRPTSLLPIAALHLLLACGDAAPTATTPAPGPSNGTPGPKGPPPPASPTPPPDEVLRHMHARFEATSAAAVGALRGDLEATQLALASLAAEQPPAGWALADHEAVAAVRDQATRGAAATSLPAATEALAEALAACGRCHRTVKGGPKYPSDGLTNPAEDVPGHMQRYLWGMDRLWEGMVQPREQSWTAGLQALTAQAPPHDPAWTDADRADADRVQSLAADPKLYSRPALYGHLLATCGACHARHNVELTAE